jgi:hypothetical protein
MGEADDIERDLDVHALLLARHEGEGLVASNEGKLKRGALQPLDIERFKRGHTPVEVMTFV